MLSACMGSRFCKTVGTQYEVQGDRVDGSKLAMRGIGSGVKVTFVELDQAFRWIIGSHGSGFEDFMIEHPSCLSSFRECPLRGYLFVKICTLTPFSLTPFSLLLVNFCALTSFSRDFTTLSGLICVTLPPLKQMNLISFVAILADLYSDPPKESNAFIGLLKLFFVTLFVPLVIYLCIRINSVSKSGKFFVTDHTDLYPRWGCFSIILMAVSIPLAGSLAIGFVMRFLIQYR